MIAAIMAVCMLGQTVVVYQCTDSYTLPAVQRVITSEGNTLVVYNGVCLDV